MLPGQDAVAGFGTECQLGVRKILASDGCAPHLRAVMLTRVLQGVRMAAETGGKDGVYDIRIPG
jgi:hypothetical protein